MTVNVYDAIQAALDAASATEDLHASRALRLAANVMLDLHVSRQTKSDMLNRATTELETMTRARDDWRQRALTRAEAGKYPIDQTD